MSNLLYIAASIGMILREGFDSSGLKILVSCDEETIGGLLDEGLGEELVDSREAISYHSSWCLKLGRTLMPYHSDLRTEYC